MGKPQTHSQTKSALLSRSRVSIPVLTVLIALIVAVGIYIVGHGHASTNSPDVNSDGVVNITDLSILLSHYGTSATAAQGDINGDGTITITDLSMLLSAWGTHPSPTPGTVNLLTGKTLISSSDVTGFEAAKANDGDTSTRWISDTVDNSTIGADLGTTFTLSKVAILWAGDTTKDYQIQISSDNINWATVATGITNNTSPQEVDTTSFSPAATGRYLRILTIDRWNNTYGNSIWELGAYGTQVGPTPSSTPTPTATPTPTPTGSGGVFRLFADTSLWNTVKSPTTYAAAADSTLQGLNYGLNNGVFSHPLFIAKSTDPMTTFTLGAGWGHPATTITDHAPAGMYRAAGSDAVMDVLLTDGTLLDMYGVTGSGTSWNALYYGTSDGINGLGFGSTNPWFFAGTTAIGSPQAAGTVLASDVAAGTINHALTMAFDYSNLGGVGTSNSLSVPPAASQDIGGAPGPLPEGGLLFIPSGTPKPSGLSAMGSKLWDAAAKYGCYITDQTGGWGEFYGDGSSTVGNAFTQTDLNAVGRALRLVKTW